MIRLIIMLMKFFFYSVVLEIIKKSHSLTKEIDEVNRTPLHVAALHGQARVCEILLENGADEAARYVRN